MKQLRAALVCAAVLAVSANGQGIDGIQQARKQHVRFDTEPQTIAASRPVTVALHFTIDSGFHINSHTPRSATLIPTKLVVDEDAGLKVSAVDFPKGHDYAFAASPQDKLDVYTGQFDLVAHITAKPGQHTLKAALHYQACDSASCYPPKLLPVVLDLNAR